MALDYVHVRDPGEPMVTIDRHLYLTEDKGRVVEEGDPAGRWLWASPGQQVARRDAERLGALTPADTAPVEAPQEKQAQPPTNKQRRPGTNKSGRHTTGEGQV